MSQIDPKVASVLDKSPDADEDDLIYALEDDPELDAFREQRLQQLHAEYARARQMRGKEHGSYDEIREEKRLMDITTTTKLCVVHFFKPDFQRCSIMDNHLRTLAPVHLDTRFLKINVENAPFLVVKLKIQVLPCVLSFIDGRSVDRIVGFEGVGRGVDSFTTQELEARLVNVGTLLRYKLYSAPTSTFHRVSKMDKPKDDEADDDWD